MAQQFCFEIYWPLIFKPISYLFGIYMACFYLSRNYWSLLDNDLTASIWEKAISILARNLNSGRSYLITTVCESTDYGRAQGFAIYRHHILSVIMIWFSYTAKLSKSWDVHEKLIEIFTTTIFDQKLMKVNNKTIYRISSYNFRPWIVSVAKKSVY